MIIYRAINRVNGKSYIGQTIRSLDDRIKSHIKSSKKPKYQFHKAIAKYGIDKFDWEILCECSSMNELNDKECQYIIEYDTFKSGYNANLGGKNSKHSIETINKISKSNRKPKSKEHINNMKVALTGRSLSAVHKRNISKGLCGNSNALGYKHSEETKRKVSIASTGRVISDETKQKLREANRGQNNWLGMKHSEDTKMKMSKSQKGHVVSDETKRKISESQKKRWAKLRDNHV